MTPATNIPLPPEHLPPVMHRPRVKQSVILQCPYCGHLKANKAQMATHLKVTHGVHPQQALAAVGETDLSMNWPEPKPAKKQFDDVDEFSGDEEENHDSNGRG